MKGVPLMFDSLYDHTLYTLIVTLAAGVTRLMSMRVYYWGAD